MEFKIVLLVDDDRISRAVARRALRNLGYPVIEASDGDRALAILEDNPRIRLVITDVVMPRMTGPELINEIRKRRNLDHVPIIIMSGRVGVSAVHELLESGASRFLGKPIKVDALREYAQYLVENPPLRTGV